MLCRRTTVFPIECVVRGYLSGSAWKEYREHGTLAGERLPAGMRESERLDPPLFSPATKAEAGHDENITVEQMGSVVGPDTARELERLSRFVYERGRAIAAARGIIIADTKFEFGVDEAGRLTLIDEALTPDSSRFWPADMYRPGQAQDSYDKQYVRDYLEEIRWNKQPPAPALPVEVARKTSEKYLEAYQQLTGRKLDV
jgi:phosphoribosylaminoimidazole-succinocarboxamide synthase